jgi:outer membrane protease
MVLRSGRALAAPAFAFALIVFAAPATAGDLGLKEGVFWDPNFTPKISMGAAFGQMDATGREYVYDKVGNRISQLHYISHQVGTIGAHMGMKLTPWLSAKIEGNIALDGDSESDDFDWLDPISYEAGDWTHYSYSGDTSIDGMHQIGATGRLELFRHPNFELGMLAGYRWDHFGWSARGGNYTYSSMNDDGTRDGYRDVKGAIAAGVKGLSYELDYLTPFVGLAAGGTIGRFRLEGEYKYSQWGELDVTDKHYLRGFAARNSMSGVEVHDWRIGGSYEIKPGLRLNGNFESQTFGEVSEVQRRYCLDTSGAEFNGNGNCPHVVLQDSKQGADAASHKYLVGLSYDVN